MNPQTISWTTALKLAWRDLRGGLGGFRVFLACLALGVMTIAALGSVAATLEAGISREGRTILGGDVEFGLVQRRATPEERRFVTEAGRMSEVATLRAMASSAQSSRPPALVEIKAVDDAYPLVAQVKLAGAVALEQALNEQDGIHGVAIDPALLARLDLQPGDRISLGSLTAEIRTTIEVEPDRLTSGFMVGPRVLMTRAALDATELVQPGSLVRWRYRVDLGDAASSDDALRAFIDGTEAELPESGWRIRSRMNAAPNASRFIERLGFFMTLAGLTALIVGGVGVANAVRNHLDTRIATIATLKCLGATGPAIFRIYLSQVLMLAGLAIVAALAAGAALPAAGMSILSDLVPVPVRAGLHPAPLAIAAVFGVLVTLAFTLWPLGRARNVPGATLFRDIVAPQSRRPAMRFLLAIAVCLAAIVALALAWYENRLITVYYAAGTAASFALLWGLSRGLMSFMRRTANGKRPETRLAFRNMHRPGTPAPSVVLSLGLGLALIVTLAMIDTNLSREMRTSLPDRAPSFFFLDIQPDQLDDFLTTVAESDNNAEIETVPMLRGRLTELAGRAAGEINAREDVRWVLRGDRGLTYAAELPEGSRLVAGEWWPHDYTGAPLVSMVDEIAEGLGVGIGDEIAVNVLGRPFTATIANLRAVEWESLGINFVMVFTPATLQNAPHTHLATITMEAERETALLREVSGRFPNITAIRMKEALDTIGDLLRKLLYAIRGVSLISLVMSVVVLAGALASGYRARLYDAAVLKSLGATRRTILTAHLIEYAGYGIVTALFAVLTGSIAAFAVITYVMDLPWQFSLIVPLATVGAATVITVIFGLLTSWRTLGAKPARLLRSN